MTETTVHYTGLDTLELNAMQRAVLNRLVRRKIRPLCVGNRPCDVKVHFKAYETGGKKRYAVNVHFAMPGVVTGTSHAFGWNLAATLSDAFEALHAQQNRARVRFAPWQRRGVMIASDREGEVWCPPSM